MSQMLKEIEKDSKVWQHSEDLGVYAWRNCAFSFLLFVVMALKGSESMAYFIVAALKTILHLQKAPTKYVKIDRR